MLIALVPVFNEEDNIIKLLDKLVKQVDQIVIVNDGSLDKTDFLISVWIKDRKNIHYVYYQANRGMAYALLQGFRFFSQLLKEGKFSSQDLLVTIDADGQHEPDEIDAIYDYFNQNNLDLLIARRDFSGYPRYRIIGNRFTSLFASLLGHYRFEDIECGFKIMKAPFVVSLLDYYVAYRYSCSGVIGITAGILGKKIDNSYTIKIPYYRKGGPGLPDLIINLLFYILIFLKIYFHKYSQFLFRKNH